MTSVSNTRYIIYTVTIAIVALCLMGFKPMAKSTGKLLIQINPVFDGQPIILNNQHYITANGDSIYIDELKFYISTINIAGAQHTHAEHESYHLIDVEDSTSLVFSFNILPGNYQQINLNLGIDSATSVAGALGGALDPVHGMYWVWNTGYINAKLNGHSNKCKTFHHAFEYHIGGYLPPHNAMRQVTLQAGNIYISPGQTTVVTVNADIAEWFRNPATVDVAKTNNVVTPGKAAMNIADNYADMLSIANITNPQP